MNDWRKSPLTATTSYLWEFLSYKTVLFVSLFWIVISAKPSKTSGACRECSAVCLSLWISKGKNAIRVRRPARLSACLTLNPKGRGGRGAWQQQQLILTIVSAGASAKDVLCPQVVDVPEAWDGCADLSAHPPLSGQFWACQACGYR